jgi:hypothetical protein
MSSAHWTTDLLNQLNSVDFFIIATPLYRNASHSRKDPMDDKTVLWQIESKHWQEFSQYALEQNLRWVAG